MNIAKWITLTCCFVSMILTSTAYSADAKTTSSSPITMDPGWPEATAVAVRDGKILSVGSLADLQPWLNKFPYTIDKTFADKIIMPGFIEAHGHPLVGGTAMSRPLLTYLPVPNPYGPPFPGVKTGSHGHAAKIFERNPCWQTTISLGL
jgi:hypothetical protein